MRKWYSQKTTWTGLVAIIGAIGGLATNSIDIVTAGQTIMGGLGLIFIRQAVNK